jgi:uncharacterized protein YheU (UPF0270 family)
VNGEENPSSSGEGPVEVPHTELAPQTLRAVIESFVLREGTDYGERDVSFERKVSDVMRQLERDEATILYDPETDSIDIVTRGSLTKSRR